MHKLCQVPRELLKTKVFNSPPPHSEGPGKCFPRDLANVNVMKIIFGRYYCINSNKMRKKARYLGTFLTSSLEDFISAR